MTFDPDTLRAIYRATSGYCHRCRRKLAFSRFAQADGRGGWEIDACQPHPRATALVPVCLACHRGPRAAEPAPPSGAIAARAPEPREGAPTLRGALIGGACGALLGALWGGLLGALLGALLEAEAGPKDLPRSTWPIVP